VDVFVSSTYRDLAEYREVLRVALTTSGHTFHGMEHFAANPASPLETCMAALSRCNVYVGLIGSLYGSSPPGRRLSYTELEYRRAMDRNMYTIILLMDDDASVRQYSWSVIVNVFDGWSDSRALSGNGTPCRRLGILMRRLGRF
jgi:Domain of unknown function (DUF4062)